MTPPFCCTLGQNAALLLWAFYLPPPLLHDTGTPPPTTASGLWPQAHPQLLQPCCSAVPHPLGRGRQQKPEEALRLQLLLQSE